MTTQAKRQCDVNAAVTITVQNLWMPLFLADAVITKNNLKHKNKPKAKRDRGNYEQTPLQRSYVEHV